MRKIIVLVLCFLMLNPVLGIPLNEETYILTPEKNSIKIRFPDLTKEYNLKDEALKEKLPVNNLCEIKTTVYEGDGNIYLKSYQNVTKQRIKSSYDCNCENIENEIIDNKTKEKIIKIIEVCDICYIYENYTVSELIKINPETFKINKDTEIYEVFEGCSKIKKLKNGKWGCSLWSEVNILGTEIKGATWWNESWNYRVPCKINSTASINLTNFPAKCILDTQILISVGKIKDNCEDIRISDNDETTLLSYEIEGNTCNTTNTIIWFKKPDLITPNDTIYIYYGSLSANDNQNPSDVWSNNYVNVWHFNNVTDSVAGLDWTNVNSVPFKIINNRTVANLTAGSSQELTLGAGNLSLSSNMTITLFWYPYASGSSTLCTPIGTGIEGWTIEGGSGTNFPTAWGFARQGSGGSQINWGHLTTNQYLQFHITRNSSAWYNWENGSYITTTGDTSCNDGDGRDIGQRYGGTYLSEYIDELRWSNITRSSDWINAEVNQLYFVGSEEMYSIPPNCSIQVTPSNILANSTGNIEILLTCEHFTGINISRFMFTNTVEGFVDTGTPNVFSIRPPENNRAVNISDGVNISENILVAGRRNLSRWFEYAGIFTDIFSYSARIENDRGVIITNTSTTATFNLTIEIEEAFRNMVYLDREKMYESPKNNYIINKNNQLLAKFWEIPVLRQGNNVNFTAISFRNMAYSGNPVKNTLTWYCNLTFNPYENITVKNSSNCAFTTAITKEMIDSISYTALNSSYNRQYFGIINGKIAGIQATSPFYVYFESDVTGSQHYYARYTNISSGTNVSFNETKTAWGSTDGGISWNQINGTMDMWVATITDVDQVQFGVYVESNAGTNYTNLTFYTDDVGYVNFPISVPTVKYYCQGSNDTCLYGEDWDLDGTYNETMAIHIGASIDPNAVGTVNHTVYLCYTNGSVAYTINNSIYSDNSAIYTDFNTSLVPDGNYKINITARADDNYNDVQSIITYPVFEIDNIPSFPIATFTKRLYFYPERKFYYQ